MSFDFVYELLNIHLVLYGAQNMAIWNFMKISLRRSIVIFIDKLSIRFCSCDGKIVMALTFCCRALAAFVNDWDQRRTF